VHVVTVNDYLAKRDAEWMARLYNFLGLSVGINLPQMSREDKQSAYAADVTYGTNNEYGFDYLRDNMVYETSDRVQRGLAFAIVDEVDSILIDEARTPLIISGQADDHTDVYVAINTIAPLILARSIRPALAAAKGVILNQSSMASFVPATAYGVTKAALNSITYGMAHVFAADGIRVNAIAPGLMETPANRSALSAETYARVQGTQLLKLHGTPQDIVALALFLASDEARFIDCEIVSCDAGSSIRGWRN